MKATELRIGNWVGFYKSEIPESQYGVIDGIELDYEDNEYKIRVPAFSKYPLTESGIFPIPITEDWLEKFGVTSANGTFAFDFAPVGKVIRTKIKYVHQLQNLFHALTGEELTIK